VRPRGTRGGRRKRLLNTSRRPCGRRKIVAWWEPCCSSPFRERERADSVGGKGGSCSISLPARFDDYRRWHVFRVDAGKKASGASCPDQPPAASARSASRCRCSPRWRASTRKALPTRAQADAARRGVRRH